MNAIALDFWNIVLILLALCLLRLSYRITWALAQFTEQQIAFIALAGAKDIAKALLVVLIGYDQRVYRKSRLLFRNQVSVRFAVLWACALLIIPVLFLLQQGKVIDSVLFTWIVLLATYVGFRCLHYWTSPADSPITTSDPALTSLIQDVNERTMIGAPNRSGHQIIRRWDYLDELFAEPA